jgi:hypothetical protein
MFIQPDEIPSFAELTSLADGAGKGNHLCPEGIAAARQWLQNIESECARVTAAYRNDALRIKFDFIRIFDEQDVKLAIRYGIDYVGLCLWFNEKYERNPFSRRQVTQDARLRRGWFRWRYISEAELRRHVVDILRSIAQVKQQLADCPEG